MAYTMTQQPNIYLLQNIDNDFCRYAVETRKSNPTITLRTLIEAFFQVVIPTELEPVILNKGHGKRALGFKVIGKNQEIYVSIFANLNRKVLVEKLDSFLSTCDVQKPEAFMTPRDWATVLQNAAIDQTQQLKMEFNDGSIPIEQRPVIMTHKQQKMVTTIGDKIVKGDPETIKQEYIKNMSVICAALANSPTQDDFEDQAWEMFVVVNGASFDCTETFKQETLEQWFDRTCGA